ncbi:MAG: diguanylate cyclase [Candidatus Muiribacteriota bacterium]
MLTKRFKFLFDIIHELYTIDDLSQILNTIVEKTSSIFNARRVSLMLYNSEEETMKIVASRGISEKVVKETQLKLGEHIAGKALKEKKFFFLEDIAKVSKKLGVKRKRNIKSSLLLVIPLFLGEKLVGALNVTELEKIEKIRDRDKDLIKDFSRHIALAIERLKLLQFQKTKIQQAVTLFEISKTLNSFIEIEDTLESFIDILATLLGISEIAIYIFNENIRGFNHKKDFNMSSKTIKCINSILKEDREEFLEMEDNYKKINVFGKNFYFLPLRHEKKTIGQLIISKSDPSDLNSKDYDIKFLSIIASQVAVILGKEILLEKLRIEKEKFRILNNIGKELSACLEMKKIEEIIEENLHFLFNYDISILVVFKPEFSGSYMFFDLYSEKSRNLIKNSYEVMIDFLKLKINKIDESKIVLNGIYPEEIKNRINLSLESHLIMPLIEKDEIIGAFLIGASNSEAITINEDLELFSIVGNYIAVTLKKTHLFKENEKLAFTDSMTDTYNYRYFKNKLKEEFERARRYNTPLTLLILDIDFFKYFNDNFGHQQGDFVLREVSMILKESVRTIDVVARYGGEEFVIIYPETDMQSASIIAERIRKKIEGYEFENITLNKKTLHITASIGLTSLNEDMKNMSDFIDFADACLYRAKNNGRNRVCYYDGKQYREEKNTDS